jgi:hypothetical protein
MILTAIRFMLYGAGIVLAINLLFHWFAHILSLHIFRELKKNISLSKSEIIDPQTGQPDEILSKKYLKRK